MVMKLFPTFVAVSVLLAFQLTQVKCGGPFGAQSYHEMFADATATLQAASRGQHGLAIQKLKDLYPLLASPARFQHQVGKIDKYRHEGVPNGRLKMYIRRVKNKSVIFVIKPIR